MKTLLSTLILLLFLLQTTEAQENTSVSTDTKNYELGKKYLKKSKTQKTVAWVMAGTGAFLFIIGAASNGTSNSSDDIFTEAMDESLAESGKIAMLAGGTLIVGSIPLFIISSNNRKKAELYLSPVNAVNLSSHKNYPQVGFALRF